MERAFGKIKLEEEVQGNRGSSFVPISSGDHWNSPSATEPVAVTDQAIYQEAEASFQQFLESYRWRLAGHPVAIMIEEEDPNQAGESPEEARKRERLERAVERGRKKAKTSNRPLPRRAQVSQRNLNLIEEEKQQEILAEIAERAANSSVRVDISAAYHPAEQVPIQVIPCPLGLAPPPPKEEDCDFDC